MIFHYYHVYCDPADNWRHIVADHCHALREGGLLSALDDYVRIGVVADSADQRHEVQDVFDAEGVQTRMFRRTGEYTTWEQRTLIPMWLTAAADIAAGNQSLVLYAHTKGAANPSVRQDTWRERMTQLLVLDWKKCVKAFDGRIINLDGRSRVFEPVDLVGMYRIVNDGEAQKAFGDGADAVAHFLNVELGIELPVGARFPEVGQSIFAGNFWWSTSAWIASKYAPGTASRYDAETWIGQPNMEGREPACWNIADWEAT